MTEVMRLHYQDETGVTHAVLGWNSLSGKFVLVCGSTYDEDYRPEGWTPAPTSCLLCLGRRS